MNRFDWKPKTAQRQRRAYRVRLPEPTEKDRKAAAARMAAAQATFGPAALLCPDLLRGMTGGGTALRC
jgi:hypothetical protein